MASLRFFKILNKSSTAKYLAVDENKLWEADEYIVAEKGKEELFLNDNKIPSSMSHKLEFIKGTGFVNPVIRAGKIDEQTFRNVRHLYTGSEKLLFDQLKY